MRRVSTCPHAASHSPLTTHDCTALRIYDYQADTASQLAFSAWYNTRDWPLGTPQRLGWGPAAGVDNVFLHSVQSDA